MTDYDNLGRVVSVTAPFDTQNAITKTYYDKNSNIIKKSVRKSADIYNSHEYKYDEMGNLLASISGEGEEQSVVQYTYDSASRITKMITGLSSYSTNPTGGSVTQYTYDKKGFLETITDPMGNDEEYWEYDKYGNLMQMSDRNVSVNTYTYGAYGLTQKSGMTGLHNTTVYNSIGQPVKTTARNEYGEMIEESYTYDPFGRLTSKTANDGTVQNYTYDNNSNVVTYTMTKDGEAKNSITYKYNSLNQLTQFDSGDMMYQYVYDNNGNLKRAYDAKLVNINYEITYNKANLPQRIETDFDSKSYDYTLSYWLNGQKYLERDTINNIYNEYAYNSNGQLEFEHEIAGNKTISESEYTYDASGNRTQKRSWNPDVGKWDEITDYTYDANNRLTNEIKKKNDEIISAMRYYYDKNGNMTAEQSKVYTTEGTESSNMGLSGRIGGGSAKVYTYDRFNRLIQYNDGAKEATYTYGADNLRASKTVNGTKTEFVWNGQNLASETTDDVTTIYNYDMTGVLGSKRDGEAEVRYHKDPHGNVLAMEKNYALLGEYTYDAFGNQLTGAEADTPFRYCGEYFDNESGNIYLRNRYYSTATGRFITEDPIKDGVNWYSYCGGNPVGLVDPMGLYTSEVESLILPIMRLMENKINYENYLHDYEFGTSYAAPYYSGVDDMDRAEYYEKKFRDIHEWANNERGYIRENEYLKKNPVLKDMISTILELDGGGEIEQIATLIDVIKYYAEENFEGYDRIDIYNALMDKFNNIWEEDTITYYSFPYLSEGYQVSKNVVVGWLRVRGIENRISYLTPTISAYNGRTAIEIKDIEDEDFNDRDPRYAK